MNKRTLSTLNRELGFVIAITLFPLTMFRYFALTAEWSLALLFIISVPIILITTKSLLDKELSTKNYGEVFILASLILVFVFFLAFIFASPYTRFHFFEVLYKHKTAIYLALVISTFIYNLTVIFFEGCKKFTYILPVLIAIALFLMKFLFNVYSVFLLDLLLLFSYSCIEYRYKTKEKTIKNVEKYPGD
ncbi:hypothetical protein [Caldisericum exile]|uniref:Uncharacterized protein n=1 Tax=Caldisericum exile (strain DSM 21853 / NBRC 104410 / AZM16c01) TaxID=511051 RepID=A0A7U6JGR0_CALEA|nr:hypothetical protein [Caldisericum exile]BAL80647.1 hypothetical protein CSE_05210 [Caldisericum exile AZM16c01]